MHSDAKPHRHGLVAGVRQILAHGTVTLLALVIAFSLPPAARYVLYTWWPRVEANTNLLLATEIAFASALVLLFHLAKVAWIDHRKVAWVKLSALVYARNARNHWLARLRERSLAKDLPVARDACVLTLTGHNTFADARSLVREALKSAYEIRVMLINPVGEGLRQRVESLPTHVTALSFQSEIETSIAYLAGLRKLGKKVTLKFYNEEPFWKLIVLGDHVWVQHCHRGCELTQQPEFVFARQQHDPRQGLFTPFYLYFLERWNESRHPEYDFDSNELVYRDAAGNETGRALLGRPLDSAHAAASASSVAVSEFP
jgi:hypothetical protein